MKTSIRCGKYWWNKLILENQQRLLGMYSTRMRNEQKYRWQFQKYVRTQNFRRSNRKATWFRETWCEHIHMILWYGRSCKDVCGVVLWAGLQDDSTTVQSLNSMPWWPPIQRRRLGISGRIVKSMLSDCSEMLVFGTYWKTWYSMVSEQTCTIHYKMDQSLWQTIKSFDLLHSSYMWIQTVLSCGKHCQTMQTGTVSRLRFFRRSWGFKIYIRWNIVHFWKSYVCSNQLDV